MAGADKTFEIEIKTTADPSGIRVTEEGLERIESKATTAGTGRETFTPSAAAQGELTAQERIVAIQTQKQILIDLELEKTQALIASDLNLVSAIESEIALRTDALRLQTSANLSEQEAFAIASRRLALEAQLAAAKRAEAAAALEANAGNLLSGASLARARNEAVTLARELGTGVSTGRTLSALLGSLGPTLAIAGVAALPLLKALNQIDSASQSISDSLSGIDTAGLAAEITAANQLAIQLRKVDESGPKQLAGDVGKLRDEILTLTDKYREALVAPSTVLEGFSGKHNEIVVTLLKEIASKRTLLDYEEQALNVAQGLATIEEEKTRELQRQQQEREKDIRFQKEAAQLAGDLRKAEDAGLSDNQRLQENAARIEQIRAQLQGLGVAATSPHEAYIKSIGLTDEQRAAVLRLSTEWQNLRNIQTKASDEGQKNVAAEIAKQGELVAQLRTVSTEAAKPNIPARERIGLLEKELGLLTQIKDSETKRVQAANEANPAAAARVKEITDQLKNQEPTGKPEDADARGGLIQERNQLIKETGVGVEGANTAIDATIKQTNTTIENLKRSIGEQGDKIPAGLEGVQQQLSGVLKTMSDGLTTTNASITSGIPPVLSGIGGLDASLQSGLSGIAGAVNGLKASADKKFAAIQAQINSLWQNVG